MVSFFRQVFSAANTTPARGGGEKKRTNKKKEKKKEEGVECAALRCLTLISLKLMAVCLSAQPCPSLSQSHTIRSPAVPRLATGGAKRTVQNHIVFGLFSIFLSVT